jgi:hypothetical protein
VAIPVAKTAKGLKPGQLIERQHVHWRTPTSEEQALQGIADSQDKIVGRVYWPERLEPGDEPDQLGPVLDQGQPFRTESLSEVPSRDWFTYHDPATGKLKYRLGYALRIDGGAGNRSGYWALTDERVRVMLLADEEPDPEPAPGTKLYTIRKGDRVSVMVNNAIKQKWCYVYQVDTGLNLIYVAVKGPAEFKQLMGGLAPEVTPFCPVPILKEKRQPRQLIAQGQIKREWRHANSDEVKGICLEDEEVVDHYVSWAMALSEGKPIPVGSVKPARDAGWTNITFAHQPGGQGQIKLAKNITPHRGDLVSVVVKADGSQARTIPWEEAFVQEVVGPDQQGSLSKLAVAIPAGEKQLAEELWEEGATVTIAVTHSDSIVDNRHSTLKEQIDKQKDLGPLNRALSAKNPPEGELETRAREMEGQARALTRLQRSLGARPWEGDALAEPGMAKRTEQRVRTLIWEMYDVVESWLEAVDRLKENRARGAELALPATLANTRPTELGNVLAAASDYPSTAYDIDVASILPRLIQVLGDEDERLVRLTNAEATMNMLLLFSFWAGVWTVAGVVALLAFSGPWWVYLLVSLGGPSLWWLARGAATTQAYAYGDELKALFDLKRRKLLTAMGFDLPEALAPEEEKKYWGYLYRLFAYGTTTADFPKLKLDAGGKGG